MAIALSEDVNSEVRRILSNNTVDQCIAYNQTMKRDIAHAQEELRDVIGQRYRELLGACDKVVGMDVVCRAIETSHAKSVEKFHSKQKANPSSTDGGSTSGTFDSGSATLLQASQHDALIVADCQSLVRSARVLVSNGAFFDAARTYIDLVRGVSDADATLQSLHAVTTLKIGMTKVREEIIAKIGDALIDIAKQSLTAANTTQVVFAKYLDIHSAVELLYGASPSSALEKLVHRHHDVLEVLRASVTNEQSAVVAAERAKAIANNLGTYVSMRATGVHSSPAGATNEKMSLEELAKLNPNDTGYLRLLTLQLCGLRSGTNRMTANRTRPSDGWALSPAPAALPLKCDPALIEAVEQRALDVIHHIVQSFVTTASVLSSLEQSLLVTQANGAPSPLLDVGRWTSSIKRTMNTAIRHAIESAVQQCRTHLTQRCTQMASSQILGTSPVLATSSASKLKSFGNVANNTADTIIDMIMKKSAPPKGKSSDSGDDAKTFSALVATAVAIVASSAIRTDAAEGNSGNVSVFIASIQAMSEEMRTTLLQGSSPSEEFQEEKGIILGKYCNILLGAVKEVGAMAAADDHTAEKAIISSSLEELYVACHEVWTRRVVSDFKDALVAAYRSTVFHPSCRGNGPAVKSLLGNGWVAQVLEGGASVTFPRAFTPGVFRAVFNAQRSVHERKQRCAYELRRSLTQSLSRALLSVAVDFLFDAFLPQGAFAENVCEEILFQCIFDIHLLSAIMLPRGESMTSKSISLLKKLEEHIDVVNWCVTSPLLIKAADGTAFHNAIGAHLDGQPAATSAGQVLTATCTVSVEIESDRLPMLPITTPTQVKSVGSLSVHHLGSDGRGDERTAQSNTSTSSSLWSATSKLRSVAAFWGQ